MINHSRNIVPKSLAIPANVEFGDDEARGKGGTLRMHQCCDPETGRVGRLIFPVVLTQGKTITKNGVTLHHPV